MSRLIYENGNFYQTDEYGNKKPYTSNSGWTPQTRVDSPEEVAYSAIEGNNSTAMPWTKDASGNKVYGGNMNANGQTIPVQGPTIPATSTPSIPVTTTDKTSIPASTSNADWMSYLNLLNGNTTGIPTGTQEDYTASVSGGELGQALQDALLKNLNASTYGYTPEEQAAIRETALADYNKTLDADQRLLANLGESLGWNQGAGQGGQSSSAFQDYFAKRATDLRGIETDLAQQFSDRAAEDKQNAVLNAISGTDLFNTISRGELADALAVAEFDLTSQQAILDAYDQYQSTQSNIAAQVSNSAYQTAQTFLAEQGINNDQATKLFATLQDAYGLDPNTVMNSLSYMAGDITELEKAGIYTSDSQLLQGLLAGYLMGGSATNNGDGTVSTVINGVKWTYDNVKGWVQGISTSSNDTTNSSMYDSEGNYTGTGGQAAAAGTGLGAAGSFLGTAALSGGFLLGIYGLGKLADSLIGTSKQWENWQDQRNIKNTTLDELSKTIATSEAGYPWFEQVATQPDVTNAALYLAKLAGSTSGNGDKIYGEFGKILYAVRLGGESLGGVIPEGGVSIEDLRKIGESTEQYKQFTRLYENYYDSYNR